ncbi:MAG: HIT domain-containing protein [Thermodesulfobacteriota bacterium]|nr:HIT domain-containing protein [Thermodesulfobacteriota bacterium]
MNCLWAPWRMEYILGDKSDPCIFCLNPGIKDSKENLVLYRGKLSMVMMNKYPYAFSHLLIAPNRHINALDDLDISEVSNLSILLQSSIILLKEAFKPEGFNIGLNQGKAAGAGIEEHLHFHLVPRWTGDVNFMPLLCETRMISEHLNETYEKLSVLFRNLEI